VQEPVVASGRPRRELAPLDERHTQPAERQVVRQRAACPTAADDQHVGRVAGGPRCGRRHHLEYRTAGGPRRLVVVLLFLTFGERAFVVLVLVLVVSLLSFGEVAVLTTGGVTVLLGLPFGERAFVVLVLVVRLLAFGEVAVPALCVFHGVLLDRARP
jgi:hypothetical protein